jgi:hypothetical protein
MIDEFSYNVSIEHEETFKTIRSPDTPQLGSIQFALSKVECCLVEVR